MGIDMKKIFRIIIDLVLITGVFASVDMLSLNVFHRESIWLDIGLYIVLYIAVFGTKRGIIFLWNRKKRNAPAGKTEEQK